LESRHKVTGAILSQIQKQAEDIKPNDLFKLEEGERRKVSESEDEIDGRGALEERLGEIESPNLEVPSRYINVSNELEDPWSPDSQTSFYAPELRNVSLSDSSGNSFAFLDMEIGSALVF